MEIEISFSATMTPDRSTQLRKLRIVCRNHPPLRAANNVGGVETEKPQVSYAPYELPFIGSPVGLAGIFDHQKMMALGDLDDFVHLAGFAHRMNHLDCPRFWRNGSFNQFRIDI